MGSNYKFPIPRYNRAVAGFVWLGIRDFIKEGNLLLTTLFYNEYQLAINLAPLVREMSWSKHIVILKKCKEAQERLFYLKATKKVRLDEECANQPD